VRGAGTRERLCAGAVVVHDVALLVAVFYSPVLWGAFNTGGQAFAAAAIGLAALGALVARWAQGRAPARIPNAVHAPAMAFLAVTAISAAFSVSKHASAIELCRLTTGVLLFFLVANRAVLPAARSNVVAALFGCSALVAAFIPVPAEAGLSLKLFSVIAVGMTCGVMVSERDGAEPSRWWRRALILSGAFVVALYGLREKVVVWKMLDDPTWQIFSTFFNPNPLGGFFAMVFPLALSAALVAALLWERMLWGFCGLLVAAAILPTYSKGAMLAFLVSTALYPLLLGWASPRTRRGVRAGVAGLALLVLVLGVATWRWQPLRARAAGVVGVQSASNMFRILTWKGTIRLASAYPWLGVGPGAFKYAYPKYATAGYVEAAHQNYLQVGAEQGVLGLAVFLWLVGAVLFTGGRALGRAQDFRARALAAGGLCSILALLVHSFLDYDWYVGAIGLTFWLVAGMLARQAHGVPVAALSSAEEPPRGRRRRSQGSIRPTAEDPRVRPLRLPWLRPKRWREQAAALGAMMVLAVACVWVPATNAAAQRAVDRGDSAAMSGQGEMARRLYQQATEYDPAWAEAWERYGLLVGRMGRLPEGERAVERATALEPTSFQPWVTLGRLSEDAGEINKAISCYRKALDRFPNHTRTLRRLAEGYQRLGDGESAGRIYRRMLEIEESPYNRYRALADVDVDVEYAYAHYELGRAALKQYDSGQLPGGLATALSEFERAMGVVQAYYDKAEKTDQMFLMLRRPREYRGEDMRRLEAKVRWRMADVYQRQGEAGRAAEERKAATAKWPEVAQNVAAEEAGGSP